MNFQSEEVIRNRYFRHRREVLKEKILLFFLTSASLLCDTEAEFIPDTRVIMKPNSRRGRLPMQSEGEISRTVDRSRSICICISQPRD